MLVAISIPIFSAQLEKSREATDVANLRNAYAECSAAALGVSSGTTYFKTVKMTSTGNFDKMDTSGSIGSVAISSLGSVTAGGNYYVSVESGTGKLTINSTSITADATHIDVSTISGT